MNTITGVGSEHLKNNIKNPDYYKLQDNLQNQILNSYLEIL